MNELINFNSRTHVECDLHSNGKTPFAADFNSRTHVECDIDGMPPATSGDNFNSRTHVECDRAACADSKAE